MMKMHDRIIKQCLMNWCGRKIKEVVGSTTAHCAGLCVELVF